MNDNLYNSQTSIGIVMAVAAGLLSLKFYQSLKKGDLRFSANNLVFLIVLIVMFGDGGSNARQFTLAARDTINNILVNSIIGADIRAANEAIDNDILSRTMVDNLYRQCAASPDPIKVRTCAEKTKIQINDWTGGVALAAQTGSTVQYDAQLDKFYQKMTDRNNSRYNDVIAIIKRNEVDASVD